MLKRPRPISQFLPLSHPAFSFPPLPLNSVSHFSILNFRQTSTRPIFPLSHPRPLPSRHSPLFIPPILSAASHAKFPKDPPQPAPDDPYQQPSISPPLPSQIPAFSSSVAQSSLSALVAYYKLVCKLHPFIPFRMALAIFSIFLAKLIGLAIPFLFRNIIDSLSATSTISWAALLAVIIAHAMAKIFAGVAHEMRNGIFAKAGQKIGRLITAASFKHIHDMEQAFHNSSRTGSLTRVVDRGTRSVLAIFRGLVFAFLPTLFELALVCVVLMREFSFAYVGVTVITFVVFVMWTLIVNDRLGNVRVNMNNVENEASGVLADSLINVEAVKAFDNSEFEVERYDEILGRYEQFAIRNEWLYSKLNIGQGAIYTTGLTVCLVMAARGVMAGAISVGAVAMLATMLQQLWFPLNFLGWQYREVKQSLIDLQNLFEILRRESRIKDVEHATELQVKGGEIEFQDVTFEYPEMENGVSFASKMKKENQSMAFEEDTPDDASKRRLALEQLSFKIPAGGSLGLVGESGSGKSTATRLMCRLYDLTSGRILIDGQDISKATIASVREAVSIVPQDTSLFNDTIAYNIRYGRPLATDEEVIAAAKAASIHDVILRTEKGYETVVGERGVRLSGGERQRLSVARAFLKGSGIILEDECTSALDTLTETEISKSLAKLGINRTRIIVAHRLSTIMNVDRIIVLENGRNVEEGSFGELLRIPSGIFRSMWERQQKQRDARTIDGERKTASEEHARASLDG